MPRGGSRPGERRGGRQPGTPNKRTAEDREHVRDFARSILESPEYISSLRTRLLEGKAQHMEPILFAYAWGKPKDTTEHTGKLVIQWQPS